jgi:hypothetical protein
MGLCSLVDAIFLSSGTEEYITVIFLGTEEYKSTEECTLFSCSVYSKLDLYHTTLVKIVSYLCRAISYANYLCSLWIV